MAIVSADPSDLVTPGRSLFRRPLSCVGALAALTLAPLAAEAQVDIESLRSGETPAGVSGTVSTSFDVQTGNTDKVELGVAVRLDRAAGTTRTLLIGDGGLGFLAGDRYAEDGLLHVRQAYWLSDRIAPEWYGQANYDRSLRLDLRLLGGVGVRASMAGGGWGTIGVGTSLMLEHERLSLPPAASHPTRTTLLRNSTYASVRLTPVENLVVTSTTYVQPAFDDPAGDVRFLETFRAASTLIGPLSLTVSLDVRYDRGPPDGLEGLDTRLETGLGVSF